MAESDSASVFLSPLYKLDVIGGGRIGFKTDALANDVGDSFGLCFNYGLRQTGLAFGMVEHFVREMKK